MKLAIFFVFILTGAGVNAQQIRLGEPIVAGSGCTVGTARAVVTPDGSAVSILFDQFVTQGKRGGNSLATLRRFCNFKIPVEVEAGYNLEATTITYQGFANLPPNHQALIFTTGPMANVMDYRVGEGVPRSILSSQQGNFAVTQQLAQAQNGRCQNQSVLDFNAAVQIFGPMARNATLLTADSQVVLDSADIGGIDEDIRIRFRLVACR